MRIPNEWKPLLKGMAIFALLVTTVYTCSVGLKEIDDQERAESARRDRADAMDSAAILISTEHAERLERQARIDALKGSDIDTPYLAWAPPQFDGATMGLTTILAIGDRERIDDDGALTNGSPSINHFRIPIECPRCRARCDADRPHLTRFIGESKTYQDVDGRARGTSVAWWTCGSCETSTLLYWPEPQSPYFVMEKP